MTTGQSGKHAVYEIIKEQPQPTISLPMASDTLRNESRVIEEAAKRASEQMMLCHDAVRNAHAKIRIYEKALRQIADDLNLTASGRSLVAREALSDAFTAAE